MRTVVVVFALLGVAVSAACDHHARQTGGHRHVVFAALSVAIDGSDVHRLHVSGGGFARGPHGRIAFITGRPPFEIGTHLAVMKDDGSHPRVLTHADQGWDTPDPPAWSSDGRVLAVADGPPADCDGGIEDQCISRISLVDAKTGTRLTTIRGVEGPSWSPDGKRLAYSTVYVNPPCGSCPTTPTFVFVSRADGRGRRRLVRGGSASWSPGGHRIAYDAPDEVVHVIRPDGSGDRALRQRGFFAWSPYGTRLGVSLPCRNYLDICLGVISVSSGRVTRVTRAGYFDGAFAWSPDGSKVAWSAFDVRNDEGRLLLAPSNGSARPRELFRTPRHFRIDERSIVFTGNGRRILFTLYGVRRG